MLEGLNSNSTCIQASVQYGIDTLCAVTVVTTVVTSGDKRARLAQLCSQLADA
jgi:hypothetical protein